MGWDGMVELISNLQILYSILISENFCTNFIFLEKNMIVVVT